MRKFIIVLIALAVVLLLVVPGVFAWYYFEGPCGVNPVKEAANQLQAKAEEFSDAFNIAVSTSRISLAGPISDMQAIKRDADDIQVPACMEKARALTVEGMDHSISGMIAFMGQENDATVEGFLTLAQVRTQDATAEVGRITKCAPFCVLPEQ